MKLLVEYIVKSLVDKPEAVHVTEQVNSDGIILELKVEKEDIGRVIGQRGQTIKAIRQLLMSVSTKNKNKTTLIVQE